MDAKFPGLLIRMERLKKGWSQEGLCSGICAVSYLSKIEQGKAEAGDDILSLLFERLGVLWNGAPDETERSRALAEALFDAVFTMDQDRAQTLRGDYLKESDFFLRGPYMLDFLLLDRLLSDSGDDLAPFVPAMDTRQRGLWLYLSRSFDELLMGWPDAFYCIEAGYDDYKNGNYARAIERLLRGHELAAQAGAVHAMLHARLTLGNCYSNLSQFELMHSHYRAAERIARALGDTDTLESIRYNIASTNLELGAVEAAYEYFRTLEDPNLMSCHKLAVCCELLGKQGDALAALDRAEEAPCCYPERRLPSQLCALVRCRLEHADYLDRPEYGQLLLNAFARMRRELPRGYAQFHLKRVEEWFRHGRQYRQLSDLFRDFPHMPA